MKLKENELYVINTYFDAKLQFEKTFNAIWYKNLIKKMFGKYEKFEITKGDSGDEYLHWIEFMKNDRVVSIVTYKDKFYLRIETIVYKTRASELFEFVNVTSNIERLKEIKEKLENEE